ncbi:hypothetical protein [Pectobacterium aroidearum]|uniref:hypothetical protein n=1 Tax=Pectobacterium aroidearum TaxID=1201031 RepID=UPI002A80B5C7|nr:hypothetical protein [Pectobacterium aroidearum]MDY4387861.1 hypothetical protein [Pectobacterium aroidearum]
MENQSVKMNRLEKSANYTEVYAEFASVMPTSKTKDLVSIQFLSTVPFPTVRSQTPVEDNAKMSVEIAVSLELVHSCSLLMPRQGLEELRKSIDDFLSKN